MRATRLPAFLLPVILGSCAILDEPDRQFELLAGGQSWSPGSLGEELQPTLGVELIGAPSDSGIAGVFGFHFSHGTDEDQLVDGVPLDVELDTWMINIGLRGWPTEWSYRLRPFAGLGFAYFDVDANGGLVTDEAEDSGLYGELGATIGSWSLRWRRVDSLDVGIRTIALDQILLGWSRTF